MSMIEKTLVRFKTKDLFNKRLGLKEIPETSICFIEDTKEIWTHGQFYAIPNEEVFVSNGEEPTGNEEIWIDLSEESPVTDIDLSNYATKKYVDDNISNLSTVATTGSYNDLSDKPIPSLVDILDQNFDPDNDIQVLLLGLAFDQQVSSITQDQYNKILSVIPNNSIACRYTGNSSISMEYSITEFIIAKIGNDININIKIIQIPQDSLVTNSINNNFIIKSDLSITDRALSSTKIAIEPSNSKILIGGEVTSTSDNSSTSINLHIGGDGTKSLMDDGKYKRMLSTDNTTEYIPISDYNPSTKKYVDDKWFDINALLAEGEKYSEPTDITEFVNSTYGSITNLRENILLHKQLYRSHVGNNVEVIAASPNLYHIIGKYGISSMHYGYIHYDLQANDDNTSITIYKVGILSEIVDGDGTKVLTNDGTYKEIPTSSPDYTVFDIVMEMTSGDTLSISQENYNKLLEKLPSNAVNTFPVRDNEVYISSLFGGYNINGDNSIWFYVKQDMGVLQNSSVQISIYQNLTVSVNSGMTYLIPVNDGIDVYTNLSSDFSESDVRQLTIRTTGDGTKALMDNGSYKEVWTPDNDGAGSGLDADTLDGYHISNIQLGGWHNFVTYEYTEGKVSYNWIKLLDLSQINSDGYIELEIDIPGDNNYPTLERLFIKISRFNDNNEYNSISIKVNGLLDNEIKVLSKIDGNRTVWICIKAAWNGNKSRIRLVGQESLNIDLSSLTTQTNEPEGGSDIVYGKCGIRLDLDTNTFRYYYDPDLNEENLAYWYEIDEDSPSTILETGGNRSVIESLKSKFRRCIAMPYGDDAAMVSYCKESYSAEWPDGTTIEIKSNHQNRMVHFPKYYHKTVKRFSNIWRTYISEQQLDNDYVEEPEALLASFEGAINSEGMLISTAHQTSASSKTINEFVTAAKTHGPLWGIGDYRTHATIARMFCAYYKNTNISTNNSNIPCSGGTKRYNYGLTGSTIHLGNIDGKRETLEDVGYYSTNFLGLEDCYYSKLEFVQGINILKGKYVVYDGGSFPDKDVDELEAAGATNIRIVGYEPNPSATDKYSGWIKTISQGKYGDVLPTAIGGSETTYYSDHSYFRPTGNRIFFRSGCNTDGSQCGVFFISVNSESSKSWEGIGARLAFYGKIVVVDSDTFKKNQV